MPIKIFSIANFEQTNKFVVCTNYGFQIIEVTQSNEINTISVFYEGLRIHSALPINEDSFALSIVSNRIIIVENGKVN